MNVQRGERHVGVTGVRGELVDVGADGQPSELDLYMVRDSGYDLRPISKTFLAK